MSTSKSRIRFVKTTLIGGLVFLVPLVVLVVILTKAVSLMMAVAQPMAQLFPVDSIGGVALANVIAVVVVVLVPSSPNPWSGPVHIMPSDGVRRLDLTMTAYIETIERFGQGTNELLKAQKESSAGAP